jgi:hypothetical protein
VHPDQPQAAAGAAIASRMQTATPARADRIALALLQYFPTRSHRCFAAAWVAGMVLFVLAMSLGWRMFAADAALVLLAAACALSLADVCYLLQTRRGPGQGRGPVPAQERPTRVDLHIVFASMLALFWGIGFFLGVKDMLS